MTCKYCNIFMKRGLALYPWVCYGIFYIVGVGKANTLKQVWKCPKCGHSEEIRDCKIKEH
jgi:hypothetical protein